MNFRDKHHDFFICQKISAKAPLFPDKTLTAAQQWILKNLTPNPPVSLINQRFRSRSERMM
jgi:hypothetical protein